MFRTCITIIVVAAALPQAEAERLDGCTTPTSEGTLTHVHVVSSEARALALRGAEIGRVREITRDGYDATVDRAAHGSRLAAKRASSRTKPSTRSISCTQEHSS
jgi:hypothetical protein